MSSLNYEEANEISGIVAYLTEHIEEYDVLKPLLTALVNGNSVSSNKRVMLCGNASKAYLDLTATVAVVGRGFTGSAYLNINDSILTLWGKTYDEVFDDAINNIIKEDYTISSVLEHIGISVEKIGVENLPTLDVITAGSNKASNALLKPELFKAYAEHHMNDVYIIPSSVQELLLIPMGTATPEFIKSMISSVNAEVLTDEDFLSNSLYVYRLSTNTIEIV